MLMIIVICLKPKLLRGKITAALNRELPKIVLNTCLNCAGAEKSHHVACMDNCVQYYGLYFCCFYAGIM